MSRMGWIADEMWAEQRVALETVIRQGKPGMSFYVIRQGEVEVIKEDAQAQVVATLGEGSCFGEEALLKNQPRNATVRTTKPTLLYVLGENDFRDAIRESESLRKELHKLLFERQ